MSTNYAVYVMLVVVLFWLNHINSIRNLIYRSCWVFNIIFVYWHRWSFIRISRQIAQLDCLTIRSFNQQNLISREFPDDLWQLGGVGGSDPICGNSSKPPRSFSRLNSNIIRNRYLKYWMSLGEHTLEYKSNLLINSTTPP